MSDPLEDELEALLDSHDQRELDRAREMAMAKKAGLLGLFGMGPDEDEEAKSPKFTGAKCQWSSGNGRVFVPCSKTIPKLRPGLYDVGISPSIGVYFESVPLKTESLLRFPDAVTDTVLQEIEKFWDSREVFDRYGLTHRRGILLWGSPGGGKTCTSALVMEDVVKRGGIGIRFGHPNVFITGFQALREIQPETPVVVLMEDLDTILKDYSESTILNVLDGVERVDRACFIATTNYPELLGPRIVNRPSRFDRRYKIDVPSEQARAMYLESLVKKEDLGLVDIGRWARDTKGFSFAHLRELFVAVVILGDDYEKVLATLGKMKEKIRAEGEGGVMSLTKERD